MLDILLQDTLFSQVVLFHVVPQCKHSHHLKNHDFSFWQFYCFLSTTYEQIFILKMAVVAEETKIDNV